MKEKYAKEDEEKLREKAEQKCENQEIVTSSVTECENVEKSTAMHIDSEAVAENPESQMEVDTVKFVNEKETLDNDESQVAFAEDSATVKLELSPFEELVRAASLLNPKQFELPIEMTEQFDFPGMQRIDQMKNGRRVKTKRLVELDANGCVPLPARKCFTCKKSCKKAPLISCDYCSLYFHQDCLDPPMCALPAGRWMCPNHPQHFIDWNLVSSLSATERLKLWNQYVKNPIDHECVKLQFFRKIHMKNPPFRTKLKPKRLDEVEVPEIIKFQYENPPSLLPSLRHVMRIENLKRRGTVPLDPQKVQIDEIDSQLEAMDSARKKLKNIFSDQQDIHKILEESDQDEEDEESSNVEKSPSKSPASKRSRRNRTETIEIKEEESKDLKHEDASDNRQLSENVEIKVEVDEQATQPEDKEDVKQDSILSPLELKSIDEQLCNLDMNTIKLLAFQRLQQIVNENPNHIQKFQDKSTAAETISGIAKWDSNRFPIPLPTDDGSNGSEVAKNKPVIVRMRDRPFHIRSDEEKASSLALSLEYPIHCSKVRSRAVLTFANDYLSGKIWFTLKPNLSQSVFMRYRSFDIGIGADNHLDLSRFGTCAYASSKHAVIFYDEVTKQFELLNYSEFGTEVNGQIFSCDFTEHPQDLCESSTSPLKDKRVAIQSKIKNMLDAKKKIREGIDIDKTGVDAM